MHNVFNYIKEIWYVCQLIYFKHKNLHMRLKNTSWSGFSLNNTIKRTNLFLRHPFYVFIGSSSETGNLLPDKEELRVREIQESLIL